MVDASALRSVAVFDLGGVLLQWDPRHLYRKLFKGDDAAMEDFLANVCTEEWNECQDRGRSFADAVESLMPRHAAQRALIEAWGARFDEMVPGAVEGTLDVLAELRRQRVPMYAISNWSAETFPPMRRRFEFLSWFDDIVLSGSERVMKPDSRIFRILFDRQGIAPESAVFIDDVPRNAAAATALGVHGIHFQSPAQLRRELVAVGLLPEIP
ncbi:MAG: HAD family phosphatase [Betaproteobacteria bacterium]